MLIDFRNIEVSILKKLCKKAGIKNYSKLKKKELFENYNKFLATKLIQRCFRNHFYKNATDHITLDNVCYPCFIYRTKSGKCYFYSYESIIKYIMKTGDCRDPMTRENYSDEDLLRLDSEAKLHFPENRYRSTYKIKKNLNYARRIRNRENEILSFHMRMDELRELIFYIIHSEMNLWNLGNDPILIENVEYRSIDSFISSTIHELKMVLVNLRAYDAHSADTFKTNLINSVRELNKPTNLLDQLLGI
jgi:hypothetical protein